MTIKKNIFKFLKVEVLKQEQKSITMKKDFATTSIQQISNFEMFPKKQNPKKEKAPKIKKEKSYKT